MTTTVRNKLRCDTCGTFMKLVRLAAAPSADAAVVFVCLYCNEMQLPALAESKDGAAANFTVS